MGSPESTGILAKRSKRKVPQRRRDWRLDLILESVRDYAIFFLDVDGIVETWNPGAERLKGYTADEIIGTHFSRFYPPEDVAAGRCVRALQQATQHGRYAEEGWRVRRDGTLFWASVVISSVRDKAGVLRGFTKVTRDMSEHRRVTDELTTRAYQQSVVADLGLYTLAASDLQPVLDNAVQLVAQVLEAEKTEILALQSDARSFVLRAGVGWDEGDVGVRVTNNVPDSQAGHTLRASDAVVVPNLAAERRFTPPQGLHDVGFTGSLSVTIQATGRQAAPYGVLLVHRRGGREFSSADVTFLQAVANVVASAVARDQATEKMQEAEAVARVERDRGLEAQHALEARDEFMSVAAHELRTPLTALLLQLQNLVRVKPGMPQLEARLQERLEKAVHHTKRLSGLVERLLDISRLEVADLSIVRETMDLTQLVLEVVQTTTAQAEQASCEILVAAPGPVVGAWDPFRLEQMLTNLLANAIKYGAGRPIEVALEQRGAHAHLTVRDHGIGVAPQDHDRIFLRFERAASVQNYGGLGLGLYITRHIVGVHGGTISIDSQLGRGALFSVELPLAPPPKS